MRSTDSWFDVRRTVPRISVDTTCLEVTHDLERESMVIDVSMFGARLERPYFGGPSSDDIYLEIVIPELDEIIVTRSEACFDQVVSSPGHGPYGLLRRTGYRIVEAASRDLNILRDFVMERRRAAMAALGNVEELGMAACYARG